MVQEAGTWSCGDDKWCFLVVFILLTFSSLFYSVRMSGLFLFVLVQLLLSPCLAALSCY